jgi:hypothetical protein
MSSSEGESPVETANDGGDLLADAGEETAVLRALAQRIVDLPEGEELPDEVVQQAFTAMTRLYTVKFQMGERWPPFTSDREMPATSVMIMSTAMLRAVNLELFELGMWQAWSGA